MANGTTWSNKPISQKKIQSSRRQEKVRGLFLVGYGIGLPRPFIPASGDVHWNSDRNNLTQIIAGYTQKSLKYSDIITLFRIFAYWWEKVFSHKIIYKQHITK